MDNNNKNNNIMLKIASEIIRFRYIILLVFIAAAVYCALSVGRVKTSSDLTAFLPDTTETRQGLTIMEKEFVEYGSAQVMVSNITYQKAEELLQLLEDVNHVTSIGFDDSPSHYANSSALFSISFDSPARNKELLNSMNEIKGILAPYDTYISTSIGENLISQIISEMGSVLLIAVVVIIAILLFTSRSYFEVVIFFIVFIFAALFNMGTNFWLGTISSITNSIAIILQLALAIDYAIIFSHRYQDETLNYSSEREALTVALAKSIVEISASSLTTISGLVALMMMQFGLGYDLGIVLAKGIVCSLLTVFLLMPGLIMFFPKLLKTTSHKSLVPDITPWGTFLMKSKLLFVIIFLVILPFAVFFAEKAPFAFSEGTITDIVASDSRKAMHKITDTFDNTSTIAVLVPSEDFDKEKQVLSEVSRLPEVKSATGLASIEIENGHMLTDRYTPRMFSELLNINIEQSTLLFQAYGIRHEEYQALFGDTESYSVPLVDMFLYLFEKIDQGIITLDDSQSETISGLRDTLKTGLDQLRGEEWNRLVFSATVPVEGEESVALVDEIRTIAENSYGEGNVLVIGSITSARDLRESYFSDSLLISILTIVFVFTILLFTFKTFVGSAILVFVIQGSIWINFALTYLLGQVPCFVTKMIVSAIQMGATIDYAIVIMNRYQILKKEYPKKEAMAKTIGQSFPTVMTSGSIMTIAGLLIAYRCTDVYIGHIGLAVGRGAFISVLLVMTVLPQLIVLLDDMIDKTSFTLKSAKELKNSLLERNS